MADLRDPKSITIRRESRQRQEKLDYETTKQSIAIHGQIHAIVVRQEAGETVLVAGERRLLSCLDLGIPVKVELWENLSPDAAREIELEENIKREDLFWKDYVRTIGELHDRYNSTQAYTAERISLSARWLGQILVVYRNLGSDIIASATGIDHAFSILERAAERRTAQIVSELMETGAQAFQVQESPPDDSSEPAPPQIQYLPAGEGGELRVEPDTTNPEQSGPQEGSGSPQPAPAPAPPAYIRPVDPIILANFSEWATNYSGPKFNLIHVDFPYGIKFDGNMGHESDGINYESTEDIYWQLLNSFVANFDKFTSYSAHILFWFDMNFYSETKRLLESTGTFVQPKPIIWHKTDDKGIIPGRGTYPRHVYESAFLCVRQRRPLIKHFSDCYGAPTASPAIHPSQKPEPVLRYFFSGLVDSTTDLLDPTCGSGTSIRAAEDCGARSVLGLELNQDYYTAALAATKRARMLREMKR